MNEVNKTLFIPLYGKAKISRQKIIIKDPDAERIWEKEGFPIHGKSKSKWLAYNMAMRARVFDRWTERMLKNNEDAIVLHIGCGMDSRCNRVKQECKDWYDCDFPEVIDCRRKYYEEKENYHMTELDASKPEQLEKLPDAHTVIVVLEGISMYLTDGQLRDFFAALDAKYPDIHILMDVYTVFGAKASKFKNPINDVGVTQVFGRDDLKTVTKDLRIHCKKEHSLTPAALINELPPRDRAVFRLLFTGRVYRRIYRLYELASFVLI